MYENSLILKHAVYHYNNHIYDTVLDFVITKCSVFKSAGYKNCTRSFKILYLKWTSEHIKKQLSKMLTKCHNNNKNHVQGKVLQSVLKI